MCVLTSRLYESTVQKYVWVLVDGTDKLLRVCDHYKTQFSAVCNIVKFCAFGLELLVVDVCLCLSLDIFFLDISA